MTNRYVPASPIVAYYLEAASVRDSALLEARAFLDDHLIIEMRGRTDVATMRCTSWWVSRMRTPIADLKKYVEMYLQTKYRLCDVEFAQSQDEIRASSPIAFCFHTISVIPDAVRLGKLPQAR